MNKIHSLTINSGKAYKRSPTPFPGWRGGGSEKTLPGEGNEQFLCWRFLFVRLPFIDTSHDF